MFLDGQCVCDLFVACEDFEFCCRECEDVLRFLMVDGCVSPCLWLFSGVRRQGKLSFIFITISFFLLPNASSIGNCQILRVKFFSYFSGVPSKTFTCGSKSKRFWSKTRCRLLSEAHNYVSLGSEVFSTHFEGLPQTRSNSPLRLLVSLIVEHFYNLRANCKNAAYPI